MDYDNKPNGQLICELQNLKRDFEALQTAYEKESAGRKKAEKELRETEERYRKDLSFFQSIFESPVHIVVFALDKNYRYTVFTRFHKEMMKMFLGIDIQIGMDILALFPNQEMREKARANFDKALNGEYFTLTEEYGAQSSKRFFFENYYYPVKDTDGNNVGVSVFAVDITGRKQNEKALQESEALYRAILNASPDDITITDLGGRILMVSPSGLKMFGYKDIEELQKNSITDFIAPEDLDRAKTLVGQMFHGNYYGTGEYRAKRTDGTIFDIEVNGEFIRGADGEPTNMVFVVRDITERKNAIKALRSSEEQFRAISENSFQSICILDLSGKVVWVNDAMTEMAGYSREQIYSTPSFTAFLAPESCDFVVSNFLKFVKNEDYQRRYQFYIVRADGEKRLCEKNMSHYKDQDGDTRLIINMIDITERYRADQETHKFRTISDMANTGNAVSAHDGTFIYVNGAFARMHGWEPKELIGKNFMVTHNEAQSTMANELFLMIKKKGGFSSKEIWRTRKDGSTFPSLMSTKVICDGQNTPLYMASTTIDISEIKQAEEKISRQNERLNAIIAAMPDLIFVIDKDGTYTEFYSGDRDSLLIPANQVVGANIRSVFDEPTADCHLRFINECIHRQELVTYEYKTTNSGQDSYFEARLAPLGDDRALASVRDITKHKQAENEIRYLNANLDLKVKERTLELDNTNLNLLKEIEGRKKFESLLAIEKQRLTSIIEGTNVGTWEWNVQTGEAIINERWAAIVGYTLSELSPVDIGTWIGFANPDDLKMSGELLEKHFKGESDYYEFETRMRHKNGEWIWVLDRGKVHSWDKDGKPLLISGTHQDITVRKRMEEELRTSEARFSLFMDYLPAIVFLKDHEGRTLFVNKYMDEAFGASQWMGKTMFEVFPNEIGKKILADDLGAMELGYQKVEESMVKFDGELHYYETQKFVIQRAGREAWLGGISLDITDRIKAEAEILKAKAEADKANLAKSEFLSRMSHELRTPMNSILGFAQLLQMGDLDPRQKKGIGHILNSGKHLLDLINEVLDIARIESGKISLSLEPVQLIGIINEMMDLVHPVIVNQHQTIKLIDSPANQLYVVADNQRLKQVMLNFINNAIKYNRPRGSVTIKTELRQSGTHGKPNVRVSVTDTGFGIASKDIPKLFKPFERIGAERTETEGTGLGLAVAKKLTDIMGGNIGVESEQGVGSQFWIELQQGESPLERFETTGGLPLATTKQADRAGTILYIEDNVPNIELVAQILSGERPNIRLITNKNGRTAVPLAVANMPDLILLDLDLPDIHGAEVLKLLKDNSTTNKIPVVIISADAMPQQLEKLSKAGAVNYLTKPLDILAFLETIDEWVWKENRGRG